MFTVHNTEITTGGTMEKNLERQLRDIMSQGIKVTIQILVKLSSNQGYIQEVGTDYVVLSPKRNEDAIKVTIPFNAIASISYTK